MPWIKYVYLREYDQILFVYFILFISGWWLVANSRGEHGFAPATFLEPVDLGQRSEEEEWREVEDDDRKFLSACVALRAPFFSFLSSYAQFLVFLSLSLAFRLPPTVFPSSCLSHFPSLLHISLSSSFALFLVSLSLTRFLLSPLPPFRTPAMQAT